MFERLPVEEVRERRDALIAASTPRVKPEDYIQLKDRNTGEPIGWDEWQEREEAEWVRVFVTKTREHLSHFMEPVTRERESASGETTRDAMCPICNHNLNGLIGGWDWDLAWGAATCGICGWPLRIYHKITGEDEEDVLIFTALLPVHPSEVSLEGDTPPPEPVPPAQHYRPPHGGYPTATT